MFLFIFGIFRGSFIERILKIHFLMSNEANFHFRAQAYMVDIPADLECKNCTIRLLRQALEWSQRYLFWSCADVDIVQPGQYREECSGHGRPIAGRCRCDRLYYGNVQP